jgi:hypothetical protein
MNDITKKVVARLCYENLLLANTVTPQRVRDTLADFLVAGAQEPRVFAVLPAVLKHKPGMIYKLRRDRFKYAKEIAEATAILEPANNKKYFHGIEKVECQRLAQHFVANLNLKRRDQHSITVTFRLKPEDLDQLKRIRKKLNLNGISQTIRYLSTAFTAQSPDNSPTLARHQR